MLLELEYFYGMIDGYVELMVEVCCTQRETVRVNQGDIPAVVARSRFLKLDREHILYVMEAMQRNTTQVANIRDYTLSALYNAPVTIGQYYASRVSHDMAQDWEAGPRTGSLHDMDSCGFLPRQRKFLTQIRTR